MLKPLFQIFVQYGASHQLSNGQLLMVIYHECPRVHTDTPKDYGFILDDNPGDFVLIHFPLIEKGIVPNFEQKAALLRQHGFPEYVCPPVAALD